MDKVTEAVMRRHEKVKKTYGESVVFTCLIGSQNYGLQHENSDIDTFTFVLPSWSQIAELRDPVTTEYITDNGKYAVKDLRLAMNLLIKTSPNSIEWFISKYQVVEPKYEKLLADFQNWSLHDIVHADHTHMICSIAGMSHQLAKRNMSAGKRYSHALRVRDMWWQYLNANDPYDILNFRDDNTRQEALKAKLDPGNEDIYECKIIKISEEMDNIKKEFVPTAEQRSKELEAYETIRAYQKKFTEKRLKGV